VKEKTKTGPLYKLPNALTSNYKGLSCTRCYTMLVKNDAYCVFPLFPRNL